MSAEKENAGLDIGPFDPAPSATPSRASRRASTREAKTRAAEERPDVGAYRPPQKIRMPVAPPGFRYRWLAEFVNGHYQDNRLNEAMEEGWKLVHRDEIPEDYFIAPQQDGLVRRGGLILAKIPESLAEGRKAYYANRSQEGVRAANQLQGVGDDTLPTEFQDRGSRVVEGREALAAMTGGN